jgi:RHS repeat-associated protein
MSKVENGSSSTFKRDGTSVVAPVLADGSANYTPGIAERRGTTTRNYHSSLKSLQMQTDTSQNSVATRTYDAFGNVLASSGTWNGPFGYGGQYGYQEDRSGLMLLGHRYYDSSTGRFLTRDPIKDGRNWYSYGAGSSSSTTSYDPTGLLVWKIPLIIKGGLYVGGLIGGALGMKEAGEMIGRFREENKERRSHDYCMDNPELCHSIDRRQLMEAAQYAEAAYIDNVILGPIGSFPPIKGGTGIGRPRGGHPEHDRDVFGTGVDVYDQVQAAVIETF